MEPQWTAPEWRLVVEEHDDDALLQLEYHKPERLEVCLSFLQVHRKLSRAILRRTRFCLASRSPSHLHMHERHADGGAVVLKQIARAAHKASGGQCPRLGAVSKCVHQREEVLLVRRAREVRQRLRGHV